MEIKINKSTFKDQFLYPISRVVGDDTSNKGCIINVLKDKIQCLCNSVDGSIILQAVIKSDNSDEANLNIFDIRKFIKIIDCIPSDDIVFKIGSNHIAYNNEGLKFKFFLMDDGIIKKSVINPDKIDSLKYDCEFILTQEKINNINKISSFTEDTNKVYISSSNGKIIAELTDKTKPNIDSATITLADAFNGSVLDATPLSLDVIRKFSGIKFDAINVQANTSTKIFMFELNSNECQLKYISTALVK